MRFLNPKTDFAFKKIFGSEHSHDIVLSLLNALLDLKGDREILKVQILDPYVAPKIKGMKDSFLDVKVKDGTGRQYIIEMQVLNVAGIEKRVLYNACKTYSTQIKSGEAYDHLNDVIALTITDFIMFKGQSDLRTKFKLRDDGGNIYSEDLELVFVELPKFKKTAEDLHSIYEKWLYFLKAAGDLTTVPEVLGEVPAIEKAFEIANKAGLSEEELDDQERREMFIQDQRGVRTKAIQEGIERGIERGRQEGETAAAIRIATALLDLIGDDEVIANKTGLSAGDIDRLRRRKSTIS